jgi:hypothetical protein
VFTFLGMYWADALATFLFSTRRTWAAAAATTKMQQI